MLRLVLWWHFLTISLPRNGVHGFVDPTLRPVCAMSLSQSLGRLGGVFKQFGTINGSYYLLGKLIQRLSGGSARLVRYYIVGQPIPEKYAPVCKPSTTDCVSEMVSPEQIRAVSPRPFEVIESRVARQHTCLLATNKGEFSGFMWFATGYYDEDEVHCRYVIAEPMSGVWDYDVFVEQRYRLGRTFARLWDAANLRLSERGIKWSFSRISAFNSQSLGSHGRMGFEKLATLTFVSFGQWQLMLSSCSPFVNVCWKGKFRPTVRVISNS